MQNQNQAKAINKVVSQSNNSWKKTLPMVTIQPLITTQMKTRVSNNKGLILRKTKKDRNLTVCKNKGTKASIQTKEEEEETKNNMQMGGQEEAAKIKWMMKKMK